MDIQTIFDRWSVAHIAESTGLSRVTLRALRDGTTKRVQHRTVQALADWLQLPIELLQGNLRAYQDRQTQEPQR